MRASAVLPWAADLVLLRGCLEAIASQAGPIDEVIVVDDSVEGQLDGLAGARVLRSGARGPYAARNVGWRVAKADLILFLDIRSRPRPDWAARLIERFDDPEVALVGSDVLVCGGRSLGARVAERHQILRLERHVTNGFFRPYFPTANLAVRRADLEAVGGFLEARSGADADLCWRILARPGRRLEAVPEVLMEWVPRDRLREYLGQNYRYGKSNWALRRAWAHEGAPQRPPMSHLLLTRRVAGVALRCVTASGRGKDEELLHQLRKAGRFAFEAGYRAAADRERR